MLNAMRSLTTKYYIITMILLLSIPISKQDSLPVVDPQNTSVDLSTSGVIELQDITSTSFVSRWDTIRGGVSSSTQIKFPLVSSGTYDFTVDWGDGTTDTITSYDQAEVTHTYISEGTYSVVIDGTLTGWQFNNAGDEEKLTNITQWGNLSLGNSGGYFYCWGYSKREL